MFSKKLIGTLGAGIFALGMAVGANPAQAAIHTVVNTADAGNGSLRDAINTTNQNPNQDQILFAIPSPGPHVISLASDLPSVTEPVAIRGYSEPNASPATANSAANPSVVIDATNAVRGLHLSGDGIEVRGLVINDAQTDGIWVMGDENVVAGNYLGTNAAGTAAVPNGQYGVHIDGDDNVIGGPNPFDRNVMAGNLQGGLRVHSGRDNVVEGNFFGTNETGTAGLGGSLIGVHVESSNNIVKDNLASFGFVGIQLDRNENTVQGNSVGTDVSGTQDIGNLTGISVRGGDRNLIGGSAEGEGGNLVSGNLFGVLVTVDNGDPAEDNDVQGNLIGTTSAGTAPLANTLSGVSINGSNDNTIGGEADGTGNVISGNGDDGVSMVAGADDNQVQGNWIGTDESGLLDLGNGESGVDIVDGSQNRVGATSGQNLANVIAHNDADGVTVAAGVGNAIVRNSLHDNGDLGIDLNDDGTTANDGGPDADAGPNGLQNGPEIEWASATEVEWDLETEPNATYRLEFFVNDACDPSGSGEGQTHLDTIQVTTDANGDADDTTPLALPVGKHVTMTATRLVGAGLTARSTSELSPCEQVQ
jgi:parallel beta-helix repeat protein